MTIKTRQFSIEGMHCQGCVKGVTQALQTLQGVGEVKVSLEESLATVQFNDNIISNEKVIKAIEDAGFSAKEVK
ncbi:MAG: heavy-metal-associated domain-containing protein [Burkholderiales bacterium]|jgi:copper chaperone CopZ|nr:heavy-metal-associated domain-containing protein [Burkholderiales bacterium]